eukprot:gb/GFBE01047886.1/.p1 GENE.gb/GFBE01047886.1/~~gb/GFBE01047886.1/.p1  ORF type:complete len:777 (+),score=137.28 gb/GFBE01047886.1/:1-2331(+)
MRVALLGGTVSGIFTAKRLAERGGPSVDLFRNLFDPARSIHTPHPLCEYQSASFLLREDASPEFRDEVAEWLAAGLVEEVPEFVAGRMNHRGQFERFDDGLGVRYKPRGGFMAMLDRQMKSLPPSITARPEQLSKMDRSSSGEWFLLDVGGQRYGPYDVVICAHDALPRASRKASLKQLFESALPHTAAAIGCTARAVSASCMSAVVQFDQPLDVEQDSIVIEGVPELQFAVRNPAEDQHLRGLRGNRDTWTLVSTTAWAQQKRPNFQGRWDKSKVGQEMIQTFGRLVRCDVSRYKLVVPTFHWMGCSAITQVVSGPPCAWDPEAGLGVCGDIFGGLGVAGAIASASALAGLVLGLTKGQRTTALPGAGAWDFRKVRDGDDDIISISGPSTGRKEPQDGLDHTWPAAVKLAQGQELHQADSLAKYRQRGVLDHDLQRLSTRGASPRRAEQKRSFSPRSRLSRPGQAKESSSGVALRSEVVDRDGLIKVTGLSQEDQRKLLKGAFPPAARGVCGGLYDAKSGMITGVDGEEWHVEGEQETSWANLGLHGNHAIAWGDFDNSLANELLQGLREAVGQARDFAPDSIRVSFENIGNRIIRRGQTLCGWSQDGGRASNRDGSLKAMVLLGSSSVTWSFKYSKEDKESLDVELQPGEALVIFGRARSWVSAISRVETGQKGSSPFDFAHVTFADHRALKDTRPEVYDRIHSPAMPVPGDFSYKWMQYSYRVCEKSDPEGRSVLLRGATASSTEAAQPTRANRRWVGQKARRVYMDNSLAGA